MLRTLYTKLAVVLLGLFFIVGGLFLTLTLFSTQLYQQEVTQKLNRELAAHIVADNILLKDAQINQQVLKELFHNLMVVNPSVELYLLTPDGNILTYSAPPGKVQRTQVSLQPIHRVLSGNSRLPILGDDPRRTDARKVFSAAPIEQDGKLQGYLYVILGSEQVDNIAQLLQGSYILRLSTWAMIAAVLFGLLAGLIVFALLTRRIRRLSAAMEKFKHQDFKEPAPLDSQRTAQRDEIDRISATFIEMAERIRAQMAELRNSDAVRRELVANVSHDLRTPLASVQGYLETLLLKGESLPIEQRRKYLDSAARQTEHLSKLIDELFELAKLDSEVTQPHIEPFSLAELVHDVAQKFQLPAQEQGVQIETNLQADTPFAKADIAMIERALDNLIENALHHTPRGGCVCLSVIPNGESLTVEVTDSGRGIPPEELPFIFERFYRSAEARCERPGGAGLGLPIARRIVELHGGALSVRNALERGTVFGFDLPMQPPATA